MERVDIGSLATKVKIERKTFHNNMLKIIAAF
jgi:hypothetical protein